jgi:hypothetical protein
MRAKAHTRRLPMLPALASLVAVAAAMRDAAATSPSPVVGHVYVNDNNTSGVNTIGAFDGGSLTELPNSPTPGPAGAQPIGIVVA